MGSVRVRIRISKITTLPLKNVEINQKRKACHAIKKTKKEKKEKKGKEKLVTFRPGIHLPTSTAGMTGIFVGTKQRGILYRFAGRYGIFRPYRPIWYEIHFLVANINNIK